MVEEMGEETRKVRTGEENDLPGREVQTVGDSNKLMFVSRNEKDKLSYRRLGEIGLQYRNILCSQGNTTSSIDSPAQEDDQEIFDILQEYYAEEYPKIVSLLEESEERQKMMREKREKNSRGEESREKEEKMHEKFEVSEKMRYGAKRKDAEWCGAQFFKMNEQKFAVGGSLY